MANTTIVENRSLGILEGNRLGTSSIRILLVEDYADYRSFVARLLGGSSDLLLICEATDGLEAVAKARELRPDVILMDIGLPRLNGLEAARRIRDRKSVV